MEKKEKHETTGRGQGEEGRGQVVRRPITAQERAEIMKAKPKRSCHDCIFCVSNLLLWARTLVSGFPVTGMCANHPDTPGQMRPVPGTPCGNFRAKSRPDGVEPPVPPNSKVAYLTLTRGLHVLVDAHDYEWLSDYKWHATHPSTSGTIYACRRDGRRTVLMHRQIMNPPKGMVVDHINGNGLDDRRCNLRICSHRDNIRHGRKRIDGQSRFIGVCPVGDKYRATVAGEYLGLYDDEVEAARARDRRAREVFGEFARLNLPPEDPPAEGQEPVAGSR